MAGSSTFAQEPLTGKASYYANKFHGRRTSDGSIYHRDSMTCAHRTLPFGTILKVRNVKNGKEVIVKVNDRGPFCKGRIVDLSYAAARELEEETGYKSDELEFLISIKTTVAFCNENIDIYVAKNLKPSKQNLDEDEFINVEVYSVDELCEMIYEGKIEDSKTVSAIMSYKNKYCI